MVKNISGGKKAKSMARKNANGDNGGGSGDLNYRITNEDMELHGVVTKMLGNGFFYVNVHIDGHKKQLLGHIRNKFKAKNKRNNMLSVGSTVIVGLREWESDIKNCDLLAITGMTETNEFGVKCGDDVVVFGDNDILDSTYSDISANLVCGENNFGDLSIDDI